MLQFCLVPHRFYPVFLPFPEQHVLCIHTKVHAFHHSLLPLIMITALHPIKYIILEDSQQMRLQSHPFQMERRRLRLQLYLFLFIEPVQDF